MAFTVLCDPRDGPHYRAIGAFSRTWRRLCVNTKWTTDAHGWARIKLRLPIIVTILIATRILAIRVYLCASVVEEFIW